MEDGSLSGEIRLTLQPDADGAVELFVEASAAGFSGRSSAWFDVDQIAAFAKVLEQFPSSAETPPLLEGGFWAPDGSGLAQRHVALRVVPADSLGTLAVQVELATPTWPEDRPDSGRRVALEVLTPYAALGEFARAVRALAHGIATEARLAGTATDG